MKTSISKKTVSIIVLSVLAALMMVCDIWRGETPLESMTEPDELYSILLWVFYISFAVLDVVALMGREDLLQLMGKVNLGTMAVLTLSFLLDHFSYSSIFRGGLLHAFEIGYYGCLASSVGAFLVTHKMK